MASLRRSVWLDVPSTRAWALLGDPGSVASWFPSIVASSMEGSRRTCHLRGGGQIIEEIVTLDAALRRLQYRVVSGMNVESHLATLDILDHGPTGCVVVYSTDVLPDSLAAPIGTSIDVALSGLPALVLQGDDG